MGGAVSVRPSDEIRRGISWPVEAIKALVRTTLSERDLSPNVRRKLGLIAQEAETIAEVIERLTQPYGVVAAVDVAAVVSSIVEVERITYTGSLDLLAGGGVTIVADEAQIRIDVHELVARAKESAGPEGIVQIVVRRDGDAVAVEAGPRGGSVDRLELFDARRGRQRNGESPELVSVAGEALREGA